MRPTKQVLSIEISTEDWKKHVSVQKLNAWILKQIPEGTKVKRIEVKEVNKR